MFLFLSLWITYTIYYLFCKIRAILTCYLLWNLKLLLICSVIFLIYYTLLLYIFVVFPWYNLFIWIVLLQIYISVIIIIRLFMFECGLLDIFKLFNWFLDLRLITITWCLFNIVYTLYFLMPIRIHPVHVNIYFSKGWTVAGWLFLNNEAIPLNI